MKPYKTITLRLDAAHYARLTETARTAGLKIEPMLRQLIMGVNLRPRPPRYLRRPAPGTERHRQ